MGYCTARRRDSLRKAAAALRRCGKTAQADGLLRKLRSREGRALTDRIRYLNMKRGAK
jgi:hypothetical protein